MVTVIRKKKQKKFFDNSKAVYTQNRRKSTDSHSPGIANMNPLVLALNYRDIVSLLMVLPKTVRIYILTFLGETQEELRELPLVSKQFYNDCKEPGLGWELLPLFVLSAKENNEDKG